jgi:hypothetical protein
MPSPFAAAKRQRPTLPIPYKRRAVASRVVSMHQRQCPALPKPWACSAIASRFVSMHQRQCPALPKPCKCSAIARRVVSTRWVWLTVIDCPTTFSSQADWSLTNCMQLCNIHRSIFFLWQFEPYKLHAALQHHSFCPTLEGHPLQFLTPRFLVPCHAHWSHLDQYIFISCTYTWFCPALERHPPRFLGLCRANWIQQAPQWGEPAKVEERNGFMLSWRKALSLQTCTGHAWVRKSNLGICLTVNSRRWFLNVLVRWSIYINKVSSKRCCFDESPSTPDWLWQF